MGDQLERFVLENREEFDDEQPSENVRKKIQTSQSTRNSWVGVWKVAAVLFLISTVYLIVERQVDNSGVKQSMGSEFEQVEQYYIQLISEKKAQVAGHTDSNLSREFLLEVERLDQMYAQLKQTYKSQNSSDRVSDLMIKNLQLRIEILNKQVKILNELKETENEASADIEI